MLLFPWFDRVAQTIAPDENYKQPEEPESFLMDFVAPPSEELSISTPTSSPGTVNPKVTCIHCHKETPVPSQSPKFRTPAKGAKAFGSAEIASATSFGQRVEEISEEQKGGIIQAAVETKTIVFENKAFQEKLDAQFKRIAVETAVKGRAIDKLKSILKKDKARTQSSGRIPLVFARSNRLYTTSVTDLPDGYTLLHAAAVFSQVEVAKALLEDADTRREQLQRTTLLGESAILVAAIHGKPKMVEFLQQYYPDQNIDVGGLTVYGNAMTSPVNRPRSIRTSLIEVCTAPLIRVPSGLSGPGGTTAGNGSPISACSRRTDAGTHQCGSFALDTTLVSPSGVSQPTRPIPMG